MQFILDNFEEKKRCVTYIGALQTAEKWSVIIEPYKRKRSNKQNRLYWSWVRILSTHFGMSDEELHEVMSGKFLGYREMKFMGEVRIIRRSTTTLTPQEFNEYLDKVYALAMSQDVALPHDS